MNYSEEWKSLWTISSVYDPPLLISRPASASSSSSSLGPLLFNPCPKTSINLLLTSPLISPRFSIPPLSYPRGHFKFQQNHPSSPNSNNNNLQKLRCSSKNEFLLLFPYGNDLNKVGFVKISVNGSKSEILSNIFETEEEFDNRVLRIEVSSLESLAESGEDISNAMLPEWKKERILGFCLFGKNLSDSQTEADGLGGFTLIKLVSFGKLESQKYTASCNFTSRKKEEFRKKTSQVVDSFLDLFVDQKYKFPRRFRYIRLESLLEFMSGDLLKVLMSKMKRSCLVSSKTTPYTADHYERICDIMKAAGVDSTGFYPSIEDVLNSVSWPMNIHEITS
ncbi:hypothetical protein FRX31_027192, partial [Thalictrum thalictroides]